MNWRGQKKQSEQDMRVTTTRTMVLSLKWGKRGREKPNKQTNTHFKPHH